VTRAVFLDRDGTLNEEVGFVARPEQLVVLPGARAALQRLSGAGFRLVVVTNQSGVARGLYTEADVALVHARMQRELGGLCAAFLHCPHHPDADGPYGGACACRKPQSGLLHQAKELLGVDFMGSWLVGDSARDLLMAKDLPLRTVYVRSGKPPREELAALAQAGVRPTVEVQDLAAAVAFILGQEDRAG
jgi:D-glycero-D-manno-heptose 1,7-bisphosphate phosphatase